MWAGKRWRRVAVAVVAVVLVGAAGCLVLSPASYSYPLVEAGEYTFHWSAAEGVDLRSPEAALVRAYAEGRDLEQAVGADRSYPGYGWMMRKHWATHPITKLSAKRPSRPSGWRYHGTVDAFLRSLEVDGGAVRATYCMAGAYRGVSRGEGLPYGSYSFWSTHKDYVEFRRAVRTPPRLPEPSGLRAPDYDVFAGWEFADASTDLLPRGACEDWFAGNVRWDLDWESDFPGGLPPVRPQYPAW